jgi:chromosome segregation protein
VRVARERDAASAERDAAERDRAAVQQELEARQAAEEQVRTRLAEHRTELKRVEEALQRQAETVRRLDGERQALDRELADLREELGAADTRLGALSRERDVAADHAADAGTRHRLLAERLVSLGLEADQARHALAEAREHEARLRADRRATEEALTQTTARRGALEQLERDHVGLAPAAATLLAARSRFGDAVHGPLADFVRVHREDASRAEHVLGEWMHAVLVTDLAACDAIHAWHRDAGTGPLLLLPLDPGPTVEGGDDGPLVARVEGDGPAVRWVRALLSGARPFAPAGDAIIRANGAVFLPGPAGTGGPLRRRAELEALGDDASRLAAALAEQDRALAIAAAELQRREGGTAEAETTVDSARSEERHAAAQGDDTRRQLSHVERDLATQGATVARLGERLRAVQQRMLEVDADLSAAELERVRLAGQLAEGRARRTELEDEHESARERRVHWQVEDAQVAARLAAALDRETRASTSAREYADRGAALVAEAGSLEAELETLERQRAAWREELDERRAALAELERAAVSAMQRLSQSDQTVNAAETRVAEARGRVETLTADAHRLELEASELSASRRVMGERLLAEWGKSLEQILAEPAEAAGDAAELRAESDELKAQLDRLGPINPLAVEEHADEKRRLEHLVTQRDDIVAAKAALQQSVRELDTVARARFAASFAAARVNFQRVFDTLFGGGSCDVFLVDEADPLESEIEITAKPRGKRTERIHLLSQGERSLVALSLLFGIYLTKPSPFCVLDEVDAPLDDANIGRFTRLLEEFKSDTQFLVITHNPRTMAVADAVYGVTMQEPGVSSVVSVRLGGETQAA